MIVPFEAKRRPDPEGWEPGDPLAVAKGICNAFLVMLSAACVVVALYLVFK